MGGTSGYGTITAHYNGVEVTAPIQVQNTAFAIRVKPMILIDSKREYPIEITTESNGETLQYDAARFAWEIGDESIVSIENGVLKGLKEGTTKIKAVLGDFSDETNVKVEVATSAKMYQDWSGWTVKSANLSADAVLAEDGKMSFSYSGKRKATITLEKDVVIYSLPDSLILEMSTTTPLNDFTLDIRTTMLPNTNEVVLGADGIAAGSHKWDLMDCVGGATDIANYPVNIKKLLYNISSKSGYVNGENMIETKLYGVYSSYTSGVEAVNGVNKAIKVMPQGEGFLVSASGIDNVMVSIYSLAGSLVYSKTINVNGGTAVVSPVLANGVYVVRVTGEGQSAVMKLIEN